MNSTKSCAVVLFFACVSSVTTIVKTFDNANLETGRSGVRLELRYDEPGRKFFLDVYNPTFANGLPRCELEDGPLRVTPRTVGLQYVGNKGWFNSSDLEYSISKAVYQVIVEGDGYLRCTANVRDSVEEVASKRLLKRYLEHIFVMRLLHECGPTQCNDVSHWLTRGVNLTRSFNKSMSTYVLPVANIRVFPIRTEDVTNSSACVMYRVEVTMNDPPRLDPRKLAAPEDILSRLNNVQPRKSSQLPPSEKDSELLQLITNITRWLEPAQLLGEVLYVRSTRFCHGEARAARVNGRAVDISWPTTELGMKASSRELCVTKDNIPQVRECGGDFLYGASWSSPETVFQCHPTTERTNRLHKLSKTFSLATKVTPVLTTLSAELSSQKSDDGPESIFSPAEIKYVADTLSNVQPRFLSGTDVTLMANIATSIMSIPELERDLRVKRVGNLRVAQGRSNSSNAILESLDRILNDVKLTNGTEFIVTRKFVTLSVDLSSNVDGIVGMAALKNPDPTQAYFRKQDIIPLMSHHNLDTLLEMDIAVGVLIPRQLFSHDRGESHRLVINLFYDDALFGSTKTLGRTRHVLSVTLDGMKHRDLNPPLILVFDAGQRRDDRVNASTDLYGLGSSCVFWDFASDSGEGGWSDSGCTLARPDNRSHHQDVCVCTHLTHFGELLRESPHSYEERGFHKLTLDFITLCGCLSSLCGLLGIAITSVVFPEWRRGTGRKVQLSLCASLALLMLSFLALTFTRDTPRDADFFASYACMATGIALHYSVVSSFCWMVVAAWGQYFRLTRPFASLNRRPHFLLKASLFSWLVPIVPCITVLILDAAVYDPPNCYPTGKYLYFAVLVPVVVAVSINATIFILILCSIYNCCGLGMQLVNLRNNQCERTVALRKLLTSVFLFMLLGLSWVFGVLNMSYVFCATASLQGLAVFVFFVILEKNTREKWLTFVGLKKDHRVTLHSSSVSADFVRRWSSGHQKPHRFANTRITTISD